MKYIITGGFQVPVLYRCSQCKRINKFHHPIKITTRSRKFDDKNTAKERHQYYLNLYRDEIWKETTERRYRKAGYKTKCLVCGHQEPWSKLRFGILEIIPDIAFFLLFPLLIFVLLLIEQQNWIALGIVATTFLLLGFIAPIATKIYLLSKREKEIAQLDYAYHPIICWREEDEKKIIQEIISRAHSIPNDNG